MPKIYEYLGLIFFFYANEHVPIHVHVAKAELESKIELIFVNGKLTSLEVKQVKGRKPLDEKELKVALEFIKIYSKEIVRKWADFFVYGAKVKCEVITKKL